MATHSPSSAGASSEPPLEIERSFLLRGMPPLPTSPHAPEVWRVSQGYLPENAMESLGVEGRLRLVQHSDGRVERVHTVKRGFGLVRTEVERPIGVAEFNRLWPHTDGRRLTKTRYRVRSPLTLPSAAAPPPTTVAAAPALTWEIDRFDDLDLVLAEVELPSADTPAPIPPWLDGWIVREVTDSPEYRNSQIALRVHAASRAAVAPDERSDQRPARASGEPPTEGE